MFEVGQVAQLVEQRTENPRVGGSIPSLAILWGNNLQDFTPSLDREALRERELDFYPGPRHYGDWKRVERARSNSPPRRPRYQPII